MTIESRYVHMAYRNFIQEVEIVAVKLLRSDFKIRKPFKKLQELLNSNELTETSLSLTQKARFTNWCNRYTEDVLWDIENVSCDTKVIESDDVVVRMNKQLKHGNFDDWYKYHVENQVPMNELVGILDQLGRSVDELNK